MQPFISKAAAISTGPDTHLDHLGVLAALLHIPLIVPDEKNYFHHCRVLSV